MWCTTNGSWSGFILEGALPPLTVATNHTMQYMYVCMHIKIWKVPKLVVVLILTYKLSEVSYEETYRPFNINLMNESGEEPVDIMNRLLPNTESQISEIVSEVEVWNFGQIPLV